MNLRRVTDAGFGEILRSGRHTELGALLVGMRDELDERIERLKRPAPVPTRIQVHLPDTEYNLALFRLMQRGQHVVLKNGTNLDMGWTFTGRKRVDHVEIVKWVACKVERRWAGPSEYALMGADHGHTAAHLLLQENRALIIDDELPKSIGVTVRPGDRAHTGDDYLYVNAQGFRLKGGAVIEVYGVLDGVSLNSRDEQGGGKLVSAKAAALFDHYLRTHSETVDLGTMEDLINNAFMGVNTELMRLNPDPQTRFSTAAAFVFFERVSGQAWVANVGDCRVYEAATGVLTQISEDQKAPGGIIAWGSEAFEVIGPKIRSHQVDPTSARFVLTSDAANNTIKALIPVLAPGNHSPQSAANLIADAVVEKSHVKKRLQESQPAGTTDPFLIHFIDDAAVAVVDLLPEFRIAAPEMIDPSIPSTEALEQAALRYVGRLEKVLPAYIRFLFAAKEADPALAARVAQAQQRLATMSAAHKENLLTSILLRLLRHQHALGLKPEEELLAQYNRFFKLVSAKANKAFVERAELKPSDILKYALYVLAAELARDTLSPRLLADRKLTTIENVLPSNTEGMNAATRAHANDEAREFNGQVLEKLLALS